MKDRIRTCHFRPYRKGCGPTFTLEVFPGESPRLGYILSQRESDRRVTIFSGDDFRPSPLHAEDSDEPIRALMGFLCLKPGDTDPEHFEGYNATQHEFADQHAEALWCEVLNRHWGGEE
jgi:hypothetical protein